MGAISQLSPQQASELFPPLRRDFAAVHIAGGGRVDGRLMAAGLLRAARRYGAAVCQGHAELLVANERVTGVAVDDETIPADQVVVTAGAWATSLLRQVAVSLPIEPQRGQIVHLQLAGQDTQSWPVILPPGSHYLLAFDDSRVVVGATRESGSGFDYRVTAAGQMEVLTEALRVAPGLASATIIETRVGFRPVALGGRPLLGTVAGIAGLVVGNGLGAAGLTIGPFAGKLLADVALGRDPDFDLAPFDPLRQTGTARRALPLR
jgi:D-amino-acid dehydrogenase